MNEDNDNNDDNNDGLAAAVAIPKLRDSASSTSNTRNQHVLESSSHTLLQSSYSNELDKQRNNDSHNQADWGSDEVADEDFWSSDCLPDQSHLFSQPSININRPHKTVVNEAIRITATAEASNVESSEGVEDGEMTPKFVSVSRNSGVYSMLCISYTDTCVL